MSTRKRLSLLLAMLIGGTSLVTGVAAILVLRMRSEIVHLSTETAPTQVKLAGIQRGFERIGGAFARISAASSDTDVSAIDSDLAQAMDEVDSLSLELRGPAGDETGAVRQAVIERLKHTGGELRRIAREGIEARRQVAEAHGSADREIENITAQTNALTKAMSQLQKSSQAALVISETASSEANMDIQALLAIRGDLDQLRSSIEQTRLEDNQVQLNALDGRVAGILSAMGSRELHQKNLKLQLDAFVARVGPVFDGDSGLLKTRLALLDEPGGKRGSEVAAENADALSAAVDEITLRVSKEIDALQLTVQESKAAMDRDTELLAHVTSVSAFTWDVDARARSLGALIWQLLAAPNLGAADQAAAEIGLQIDEIERSLANIQQNVSSRDGSARLIGFQSVLRSFEKIRLLWIGPEGVTSVVKLGLVKQREADHLFTAARLSIYQVARQGSTGARHAEIAQEDVVARILSFSLKTLLLLAAVSLCVLIVGLGVGGRIRGRIIDSEEAQSLLSDRLRDRALHDDLTGLPNRLAFGELLAAATVRAASEWTRFAVFCIDLDRFKHVNDTLGHRVGDLFLIEIANRMRNAMPVGGVAARMGGDEFGILIENLGPAGSAEAAAQSLLRTLSEPLLIENCSIQSGASIGIARFPQDATDPDALQRNADLAMYRAKKSGRNQLAFFDLEERHAAEESEEIRIFLASALRNGEFGIEYQPLVSPDGKIAGLEALLRLRHPRLGAISPARFIPIAEASGLIVPIGTWVLRQVVKQSREWRDAGFKPVRIGVNVSALQFAQTDFFESVRQMLLEGGMPPHLLDLELTETVLISNFDEGRRQMAKLRALGITISIDDFGTGYSSLSYLHKLPVDTLKVDQGFIRELNHSKSTLPLIQAIVSAAHALGLSVVAEGVETEAQRKALARLGCDAMQGYLFARPQSVAGIETLLRREHEADGALQHEDRLELIAS